MENKPTLRGGSSSFVAYDDSAFAPAPEQQNALDQTSEIASKETDLERQVMEDWLFPNMYPAQQRTFEDAFADWLKKPGNEGKGIEDFKNAFSNKV